jgi:O-antigen/teichoic acid export membrane protein
MTREQAEDLSVESDRPEPTERVPSPPPTGEPLAKRVAGSALNLVAQFGFITLLSGLTTIVITRLLGPSEYGAYGFAVATFTLLGATADLGFSLMLSRDMAQESSNHRALLRTAYEVGSIWSIVLALIMAGLAFAAPLSSQRGMALLVLAPAMAVSGLNPARIFFVVTYRTRTLVIIDVVIALVQAGVTVVLAALGLGPVALAASVSVGSIVNNLIVAVAAHRMLGPSPVKRLGRIDIVRRSVPLGLMSIMTKVYFSIDLVLLGWFVTGPQLGNYAAASKLLGVTAGLAGAVMGGALPALASTTGDRDRVARLATTVWHWLLVGAVPMFLGIGLFAPLIVQITIGQRYATAVPLIRILCLAGLITGMSNLIGIIQVARRQTRALFVQNGVAMLFNIAGNVLLIPRYGAYASAWMTLATEVLVCSLGMFSLRREVSFGDLLAVSRRPGLALCSACVVGVILIRWQWIAAVSSGIVLLLAMTILHAWPQEFRPARLLAAGASVARLVRR